MANIELEGVDEILNKLQSIGAKVKVSPKSNSDTLYADNRAVETVSSMGEIQVEIET